MTNAPAIDGWGVLEHAVELARRNEDFVLATVVWRQGPSSGQQGSRAIVMASGEVLGWIGGACAEPVLVREALSALADGQPRLLALGTADELIDTPEGVTAIAISCQSDGALQVFVEPFVLAPHLVVVGRSPMAQTLFQLARDLGWNAELIEGSEFSTAAVSSRSIVVVATQGHGDEDIIEQAVAAGPAYLGVVGSQRRGQALRGYLQDRNISQDLIDSIRVPVGLDLGRTTHREVAVAVLAELVELRATGELGGRHGVPAAHTHELAATQTTEAVDPICGMTVTADDTSYPLEINGVTHYFCCSGCRVRFEADAETTSPAGSTT